jgi:cytochrome P450
LDKLLLKNPLRLWLSRIGLTNVSAPVAVFAKSRMEERLNSPDTKPEEATRRDFLSRFMEAGEKDPDFMDAGRVLSLTAANMFAGSDTTAISLRSIFYYLLKTPEKLGKLRHELIEAEKDGLFTRADRLVRWGEANKLPYLSAVIKEALRIHPAAGLLLERVVPPSGVTLNGRYIPASTIVGCNAWTIHRNKKVFGEDADEFRPERWLEDPANAAEMNQFLFTFGAGARTCIGKNISYLEMYKLVPAILRTFDVCLAITAC